MNLLWYPIFYSLPGCCDYNSSKAATGKAWRPPSPFPLLISPIYLKAALASIRNDTLGKGTRKILTGTVIHWPWPFQALLCYSFVDIDRCARSFEIPSLTGSQWLQTLPAETSLLLQRALLDKPDENPIPGLSPVRSTGSPWEIFTHPSPHILCLLTYLMAAALSELCHQSSTLCVSFLLSQIHDFTVLEVRCSKSGSLGKIKVLVGLCSFWRLRNHFLPLPASGGYLHSLACATLLPSSHLLWPSCLPFKRILLITLGSHGLSRITSLSQDP